MRFCFFFPTTDAERTSLTYVRTRNLGRFHFTALLISPGKKVWYHDGQTTGQNLELKGDLDEFSEKKLYEYNGMKAVTVMYAKK